MTVTVDFGQDGKEALAYTSPTTKPINVSGTYTVSGNSLTQHYTSVVISGKTFPLNAEESKPKIGTFVVDGDRLTVTDATTHKVMTLTRVTT